MCRLMVYNQGQYWSGAPHRSGFGWESFMLKVCAEIGDGNFAVRNAFVCV